MRKTLFLGFTFLALTLTACSNPSSSSSGDPGTNGMYYWADAGYNRYVLVGIADPSSFDEGRATFAPKSGYWYAIWFMAQNELYSDPVSMGTISVDGVNLNFSPFPNMGFSAGDFVGTLIEGVLTMEKIPGTNFGLTKLKEGGGFDFDPDNPGGNFPIPPDEDDGTPGGNSTASAVLFTLGKYVSDVVFLDRPTASIAYEGFPVDLKGMRVEITYSNGEKKIKTDADAGEFVVEPPIYESDNGAHYIRYIAEYNYPFYFPSSPSEREFRAPQNDSAQGTYFYDIKNSSSELEVVVTGEIEYFEGDPNFDFSGVNIKATYSTGEKTITPTPVYKTRFFQNTTASESEILVTVGRKYASIILDNKNVYPVSKFTVEKTPDFPDPILFDDPRFYSQEKESHWLSRLGGTSFGLAYAGTKTTKSIKLLEAYYSGRVDIDYPLNITDPRIKYTFVGDNRNFEVFQVVPVYNRLSSISVESLKGLILLRKGDYLPEDDEQSFLKQVKISAVYQLGSDKNKTIRRENILIYPDIDASIYFTGVDTKLINASPIVTNVNKDPGGILNSANSLAYLNKRKLTKAMVSFTTNSVGSVQVPATKTATIEVGVLGY